MKQHNSNALQPTTTLTTKSQVYQAALALVTEMQPRFDAGDGAITTQLACIQRYARARDFELLYVQSQGLAEMLGRSVLRTRCELARKLRSLTRTMVTIDAQLAATSAA